VSRYQKGRTNLDFTEARDSEWQWHHLGHMQVCTSLQADNHASTPPLIFFRPDALPATQPTASKHKKTLRKFDAKFQYDASSRTNSPLLQSLVENAVVSAQYKDDVKPTLGEEFTAVVVNDVATFTHTLLQLVNHLNVPAVLTSMQSTVNVVINHIMSELTIKMVYNHNYKANCNQFLFHFLPPRVQKDSFWG